MAKFNPGDPIWIIQDRIGNPAKIPGIFIMPKPGFITDCVCEVFGYPGPVEGGYWFMRYNEIIPRKEPPASLESLREITGFIPKNVVTTK